MDKHYFLNEFPEQKEKILALKAADENFKSLYEQYNDLNHEVEKIENGLEPTSDAYLNELRLKRVDLKDKLFALLQ